MKSQRLEIGLAYPAFLNHQEAPAQGGRGGHFSQWAEPAYIDH